MLQVGYAPVIVSIMSSFCSPGKFERHNCLEIAITSNASFALAFVSVSLLKLQSRMYGLAIAQ